MKESKILKILSYILIPILILIIVISVFYEIANKEIKEFNESKTENFFESDTFLSIYMNRLANECNNLIHANN